MFQQWLCMHISWSRTTGNIGRKILLPCSQGQMRKALLLYVLTWLSCLEHSCWLFANDWAIQSTRAQHYKRLLALLSLCSVWTCLSFRILYYYTSHIVFSVYWLPHSTRSGTDEWWSKGRKMLTQAVNRATDVTLEALFYATMKWNHED